MDAIGKLRMQWGCMWMLGVYKLCWIVLLDLFLVPVLMYESRQKYRGGEGTDYYDYTDG